MLIDCVSVIIRSGDIEKAAVKLRKSIQIIAKEDPNNPRRSAENQKAFTANVYNYLGYTWVENDMNIDEGGELIKSALELDPESGAITDSLGWYYFKKEKYEDSLKTLLKAKEIMDREREEMIAQGEETPEVDGVILDHIAQAYWMTGRKKEALDFMEQAIAVEVEHKTEFEKRHKEYQNSEPPVPRPVEEDAPPEKQDSPKAEDSKGDKTPETAEESKEEKEAA